ncbi:iron chelate uptake ABC transporter family permease subunit [Corynebacterium belfantii]
MMNVRLPRALAALLAGVALAVAGATMQEVLCAIRWRPHRQWV